VRLEIAPADGDELRADIRLDELRPELDTDENLADLTGNQLDAAVGGCADGTASN